MPKDEIKNVPVGETRLNQTEVIDKSRRSAATTSALRIEVGPGGRGAAGGNAIGGPVSLDQLEGDSQGLAARARGADR